MAAYIDLTQDLEHDELDILTATSPTVASTVDFSFKDEFNTSRSPEGNGLAVTRSLRPRAKLLKDSVNKKRKRTTSVSEGQKKAKLLQSKLKMDDKRALTIVINVARANAEAARKCWLHRHRDLFIPLLPPSNGIFNSVRADVGAIGDHGAYTSFHEMDEQPKLVTGAMKDYQLHGLSFLVYMYKNGMNCILGDEMGLGKTLQTLSLFAYIKENAKGNQDPYLVVCPLSVLSSWLAEAHKWVPSLKALRFHGHQSERNRLKDAIRAGNITFDICVTTYEVYAAEDTWFKSRRWTYCALDEGHKIKNASTNIANQLQGIGSMYRLVLTGTPVQNNLVELWSILHWLFPTIFTAASERLFKDSFDLSRGLYSIPFLKATEKLLAKIMLRRTKAMVEFNVPPREELTVFVPMTEAQRFWTYRLLTRMDSLDLNDIFTTKLEGDEQNAGRKEVHAHLITQVSRGSTGNHNRWKKLMNLLIQLRLVCDHPYLLPDAEPEPYTVGEHLVASSSKLIAIDKLLADLLPKGERVLIFSQWTNMLELLEDLLHLRGIPHAKLDGSTRRPRRALDIKLFQREKSPFQVFLISTRAGGLGINLTKATTIILFDSDWNPQNDLQAIARAHRIGQTKTVKVYRLICRGSVEDQMLDRIRRKLFLSLKVMGAENTSKDDDNHAMKTGELMDILRKGSSALSQNIDGMDLPRFLAAPVKEILDASRERDDLRIAKVKPAEGADGNIDHKSIEDAEEEERKLLRGVAQVQSRLFEGRVVEQPKNSTNSEIAAEWRELQKRSHVNRIVKVDGMEMIAEYMGPEVLSAVEKKAPLKRGKRKFEWEDWCIYCRDGGELVLCTFCPRVCHPECQGLTKRQVARASSIACGQHKCATCNRSTADAGGMLFRCRTCPQAFCEDCLPDEHIDAIGDTLPELELLGYGANDAAYYINCADCHRRRVEDPAWWASWREELDEAQKRWETTR